MTDRINGFLVAFDKPIREDDAQVYMDAVRLLAGVTSVTPYIANPSADYLVEARTKEQLLRGILEVFQTKIFRGGAS